MATGQQTLWNPLYRNWVKCGLVLKFTRDGLQSFVDGAVQDFQQKCLNDIWARKGLAVGTVCNVCTTRNVLPCPTRGTCAIRRGVCNYHDNSDPLKIYRPCPSGICNDLQDIIYKRHRFGGPSWHNTNAQLWCSNSWEIAKCYMLSSGYSIVTSAVQTDLIGLLLVVINLTEFQNFVVDNLSRRNNLFCQARTIRSDIMHTATSELTDVVLNDYIDTMALLLNDPGNLARDENAQTAVTMLNQLRTDSMIVTNEDKRELSEQALHAFDERKEKVIWSIKEMGEEAKEEVKQEGLLQVKNIQEKTEEIINRGLETDAFAEKKRQDYINEKQNLYKSSLQRSDARLMEDLDPQSILHRFFEIGFLPYTTIRDIQEVMKLSAKNRTIIDQVKSKGPDGYITFKMCLNDTHQGHLADYLTGLENQIKQEEDGKKHSSLPLEIRRMDERSIEIYKHALATGEEPDHSIRVMVVGHSGVGKTTLTKRLLDEDVDLSENKSTDGIEIHQRKCRVNLENGDWTKLRKDEISENYKTRQRLVLNKHLKYDSKPNELQKENEALTSSINDTDDGNKNTEIEIVYKRINENKETEIDKKNEVSQQADDRVSETLPKSGEKKGKKDLEEVIESDAPILENTAELSIWDFAGQYVYYCTHHIFLSRRAIYLLVTDIREDINSVVNDDGDDTSSAYVSKRLSEYIQFWLNSIHCNCSTLDTSIVPSVLLVGTHAGETENNVAAHFSSIWNILKDETTKEHIVDDSFPVENKEKDHGHEKLKHEIVEVAKQQSYWGKPIPCRWVKLEQKLDTMRDKGYKIIKRTRLDKINKKLLVPLEQEELDVFLEFHESCGNLIYYKNEPSLNENILLDPQWLVDALKCLISSNKFIKKHKLCTEWSIERKRGRLTDDLIDRIWKHTDEENKKEKEKNNEQRDENKIESFYENRNYLICLLETFNIIAKPKMGMTLTDTKTEDDNFYFVPCLLKGSLKKEETDKCQKTSTLCFKGPTNISMHAIYCKLMSSCIKEFNLKMSGKKYMISSDCGIFYLNKSQTYTLEIRLSASRDRAIQIMVAYRIENEFDLSQSQRAKKIIMDLSQGVFKEYVLCPECKTEIDVGKLRDEDEYVCDAGNDGGHKLEPQELLQYWYEGKKHEQKRQGERKDITESAVPIPNPTDHELKKSIDDTMRQSIVHSLGTHMFSVGALIYPNGRGTVFRVGSVYVMTAWHVVRDIIDPMNCGEVDYTRLEDDCVFINFNETPDQPSVKVFRVKGNVPFKDEDLDVAVLEVANPQNMPTPFVLSKNSIEQIQVSEVSFIGYGHPNNPYKTLDPRCYLVSQFSNEIDAALASLNKYRNRYRQAIQSNGKNPDIVDVGYCGYDQESKMVFKCFMEHGASGSPAIITKDPRTLYVVGVLTCGIPDFYFELPKQEQDKFSPDYRFEIGARMTHVHRSMSEVNPSLASDLFGDCSTRNAE